jgi:hypothetical protein
MLLKGDVENKVIKEEIKNFDEKDINTLINRLNLDYNNKEREEIIEELGLKSKEIIEFDNLILKSRVKRRQSKFANFYENLLNLFTSPSELIVNILLEAKDKLLTYNETRLSEDIEWVIRKIKNEDIYNINVSLVNNLGTEKLNNPSEFENTMKLLSEYSTDNFNRNKREDIVAARNIGKKRLSIYTGRKEKKNSFHLNPSINNYHSNSNNNVVFEQKSPNINNIRIHNVNSDLKEENLNDLENNINSNGNIITDKNVSNSAKSSKASNNEMNLNGETNTYHLNILNTNEKPINQLEENIHITEFLGIENHVFDTSNFNVFDYISTNGREMVLHNLSFHIFNKYNLFLIVNESRFDSFLNKVKVGYDFLLPYHNEIHASDVLQTSHIITMFSNLQNEMDLTILDLSGFFIAAIIHDYKHPGLNNNFHINKRSNLSRRYNDISVLENYHVSSAFKIISQNNSNIFCDIQNEEYRVVRKRIVECVLATDMAKHAKEVASLKIKLENYKKTKSNETYFVSLIKETSEESKFDRQQEMLNFFIHCADISNPTKQTAVCVKWTELVMKEFFEQGDLEKSLNLPVSFLCDRSTTNIPKSQIGFINNIVMPCFSLLTQIAPKLNYLVENLKSNSRYWTEELGKEVATD